jgi:hypothetical protein
VLGGLLGGPLAGVGVPPRLWDPVHRSRGAGRRGRHGVGVLLHARPVPTGSARVSAFLFFGVVALLFVVGIVAQVTRPQFLRRVGATEVISPEA